MDLPPPPTLDDLRKWREDREKNKPKVGLKAKSKTAPSPTRANDEKTTQEQPTSPGVDPLKTNSSQVKALSQYKEEIGRLKSRFNKQIHKERGQTSKLVSNLEEALTGFRQEIENIKLLLPMDQPQVTKSTRRDGTRRTLLLGGGQESQNSALAKELLHAAQGAQLSKCIDILEGTHELPLDVNIVDDTNRSPIFLLVERISIDEDAYSDDERHNILPKVLELLIELGADVNMCDESGRSAFWIACDENELDLVSTLVQAERPGVSKVNKDGAHVLSLLANPNQSCIEIVQNHTGSGHYQKLSTIWHLAIEKGSIPMLKLLVEAQLKLEVLTRELIESGEEDADGNVVRHQNSRRQSQGWGSSTPQHTNHSNDGKLFEDWKESFELGDTSTWVKQTNRLGNRAWRKDGSPLHIAILKARHEEDAQEMIDVLLDELPINQDADVFMTLFDPNAEDEFGNTPLHIAARFGFNKCIASLLTYCHHFDSHDGIMVNINKQESRKRMTALMIAIQNGHETSVEELFERNNLMIHVAVPKTDGNGKVRKHDLALRASVGDQTALHLACCQPVELDAVVLLLCKNKGEVNLKDKYGFSPLHLAAMNGHVMIVKCLLKYNANAASVENFGKETALHIAAALGHINILNVLLRKGGAEVHSENKKGRTALHHAFQRHLFLSAQVEYCLQVSNPNEEDHPGISEQITNFKRVMSRRLETIRPTSYQVQELLKNHFSFEQRKVRIDAEDPDTAHTNIFSLKDDLPDTGSFNLELLFLAINNQNMLIKMLLDAGGDLDHEDKFGDPAFITSAKFDWFDIHEEEMTEIYDHPNEMGYDSAIFTDKRTQFAVRAKWIHTGERTRALQDLLYWMVFLILLTVIAINYSGRDSHESFSMQQGIIDRVVGDEWDPVDLKGLDDVGNLEDWELYLKNVLIGSLWESNLPYYSRNSSEPFAKRMHTNQGAMLNGMLSLVGRPRYRQIRTASDSCSNENPSLTSQTDGMCFHGATRGTYMTSTSSIDKSPFNCTLQNSTELTFEYEENKAYPINGKFGYYSNGGFSIVLPKSASEAEELIDSLTKCDFLALNTRLAVVEFTLYSRSQQLFTHGAVFLELTAAGGIVSGNRWETRKLVNYSTDEDFTDLVPEILWFIMVIFYCGSEFLAMRESWGEEHIQKKNTPMWWAPTVMKTDQAIQKLMDDPKEFKVLMALPRYTCLERSICMYKTSRNIPPYWVSPFNYVDCVIMMFIITLIGVHISLVTQSNARLSEFKMYSNSENFVDVSDLFWLASVRQHLLAIVVLLCYIKSLEYLQVTRGLAIPVIIIGGMLMQLLSFFLIFAVFILAFALFDFVLYGLTFEPTSSVLRSVVFTFRAALGDLDFDGKYELDRTFAIMMTCVSAFLLVVLLLNLLIAVMNEAYEEIKDSAEARWCYMQFRMIVQNRRKVKNIDDMVHAVPNPHLIEKTLSLATARDEKSTSFIEEEDTTKTEIQEAPQRRDTAAIHVLEEHIVEKGKKLSHWLADKVSRLENPKNSNQVSPE
uniref:Ion transport domain-containing protein n=1 Tax=Mucochytrium quahogii TaxID=96639 RepID=A0A7S2S7E1_9STRA|mmetsp:Transcript_19303/g.32291  ORF Transcript_19303/g.32291 Transcript_19303/m.32291 type:complete len:1520 (+) Transcript_19303:1995-6554(+)|eukprot:CAMPEP_0203754992 /NCGR_PEP_ID=MMETSP0098-20131031/8523_1 /ASSEMBLY_ACC=CAM_ASM_000208 /TAXON_ID=96639 /ORGANISM=" , Strain NY0313808BC1" /LENGTH=1519 /DNA_ID=CAMNT_0050646271 /DNA_START=1965 /DNA_END=6521 /DNA_ORIENTATION=+